MEPKFKVLERPSKLDLFAEKLSVWLVVKAGKSRKLRRTLKQMHRDLVALGFDGSYGRVAAFARRWKAERQREQQTSGRQHSTLGNVSLIEIEENQARLTVKRGYETVQLQRCTPKARGIFPIERTTKLGSAPALSPATRYGGGEGRCRFPP